MTRKGGRQQRAALERKPVNPGGSLFTGLFVGLVVGLLIAAAMAWYFYARPSEFKSDPSPIVNQPAPRPSAEVAAGEPPPMEIAPPPRRSAAESAPRAGEPDDSVKPPAAAKANDDPYSFYDILPGEKSSQPKEVKLPREVWWLQVAALKAEKDAQALKARLTLLGLTVKVNRVDNPAGPLHRVRVGPFKTEDDALGALDTLAVNNFEPRLFKEQLTP